MQKISSSVRQSLRTAANAIVQSKIKMRAITIAALLAATPALAQEVPTPLAVATSGGGQSGTLDSPTDTALYSVYLSTNQVVAIGIYGDGVIMDLLDRSKLDFGHFRIGLLCFQWLSGLSSVQLSI
jgi:hypothetical protein